MIKNRTTQLICETVYVSLGLVAFAAAGFLFVGLDRIGRKKTKVD